MKAVRQALCSLAGCQGSTLQSGRLLGKQPGRPAGWHPAGWQACTLEGQQTVKPEAWVARRLEVQNAGRPVARQGSRTANQQQAGQQSRCPAAQQAGR